MHLPKQTTNRLIYLNEVQKFTSTELSPIEKQKETGTQTLNIQELATSCNSQLEKSTQTLTQLPQPFLNKFHDEILSFFLNSISRFDKNNITGLNLQEYQTYRTSMLNQLQTQIQSHAPTQEEINAINKTKQGAEQITQLTNQVPSFESKQIQLTEADNFDKLNQNFTLLTTSINEIQNKLPIYQQQINKLKTSISYFETGRNGIEAFMRLKSLLWPEKDQELKNLQTRINNFKQIYSQGIQKLRAEQQKLKTYGEALKQNSTKLKQTELEKRQTLLTQLNSNQQISKEKLQEYQTIYNKLASSKFTLTQQKILLEKHLEEIRDAKTSQQERLKKLQDKETQLKQEKTTQTQKITNEITSLQNAKNSPNLTETQKFQINEALSKLNTQKNTLNTSYTELLKLIQIETEKLQQIQSTETTLTSQSETISQSISNSIEPQLSQIQTAIISLNQSQTSFATQTQQVEANFNEITYIGDQINESITTNLLNQNLNLETSLTSLEREINQISNINLSPSQTISEKISSAITILPDMLTGSISFWTHGMMEQAIWITNQKSTTNGILAKIKNLTFETSASLIAASAGMIEMANGLITMISHPIKTAKGMGALLGYNSQTQKWGDEKLKKTSRETFMKELISYDDFKKGHIGIGIGKLFVNIATSATGAGAMSGAAKGAKAAYLSAKTAGKSTLKATGEAAKGFAKGAIKGTKEGIIEGEATREAIKTFKNTKGVGKAFKEAGKTWLQISSQPFKNAANYLKEKFTFKSSKTTEPKTLKPEIQNQPLPEPQTTKLPEKQNQTPEPTQKNIHTKTEEAPPKITAELEKQIELAQNLTENDFQKLPDVAKTIEEIQTKMAEHAIQTNQFETILNTLENEHSFNTALDLAKQRYPELHAHYELYQQLNTHLNKIEAATKPLTDLIKFSAEIINSSTIPSLAKKQLLDLQKSVLSGKIPMTKKFLENFIYQKNFTEANLSELKKLIENQSLKPFHPLKTEELHALIKHREIDFQIEKIKKIHPSESELTNGISNFFKNNQNPNFKNPSALDTALLNLKTTQPEIFKLLEQLSLDHLNQSNLQTTKLNQLVKTEIFESILHNHIIQTLDESGKPVTAIIGKKFAEGGLGEINHTFYLKNGNLEYGVYKQIKPNSSNKTDNLSQLNLDKEGARIINDLNRDEFNKAAHILNDGIIYESGTNAFSLHQGINILSPSEWLKTIQEIIPGLNELHKKKLGHYDLKATNIIVYNEITKNLTPPPPFIESRKYKIIDNSPTKTTDNRPLTLQYLPDYKSNQYKSLIDRLSKNKDWTTIARIHDSFAIGKTVEKYLNLLEKHPNFTNNINNNLAFKKNYENLIKAKNSLLDINYTAKNPDSLNNLSKAIKDFRTNLQPPTNTIQKPASSLPKIWQENSSSKSNKPNSTAELLNSTDEVRSNSIPFQLVQNTKSIPFPLQPKNSIPIPLIQNHPPQSKPLPLKNRKNKSEIQKQKN